MKPTVANILWISDIHYQKQYDSYEHVNTMFLDFINFVKTENETKKITHVVITGDLAFSGDCLQSYKSLATELINKLKTALGDKVPFLITPGNHDVMWNTLLAQFTKQTKEPLEFFKYYENIKNTRFFELFTNLSSEIPLIPDQGILESDVVVTGEQKLYGIYFDSLNNILFILLNSAFLSFGDIKGDMVEKGAKKASIIDVTYNKVFSKIMASSGKSFTEYGNQTYARYFFRRDKITDHIDQIIKKFNPMVVSLAHHPPDWIHWREKFTSHPDSPAPLDRFLFNKSHLHLVGHEHSTPTIGSRHGLQCLMLRAGKFLDKSVEDDGAKSEDELFKNNWFSFLKVSRDSITHERIQYKFLDGGGYRWTKKKDFRYSNIKNDVRQIYFAPDQKNVTPAVRDEQNCLKVDVEIDRFNYLQFLKDERAIDIFRGNSEIKLHNPNFKSIKFKIYKYPNQDPSGNKGNTIRVLFLDLNSLYHTKNNKIFLTNECKEFIDSFNQLLNEHDVNIHEDKIIFSLIDVYVFSPSEKRLTTQSRIYIGNTRVSQEALFNVFRHHFNSYIRLKQSGIFETFSKIVWTYDYLDQLEISNFVT